MGGWVDARMGGWVDTSAATDAVVSCGAGSDHEASGRLLMTMVTAMVRRVWWEYRAGATWRRRRCDEDV